MSTREFAFERRLNAALTQIDIREGFDAFFETFKTFYHEDIEVSFQGSPTSIRGIAQVLKHLAGLFEPLHIMAEVAGLQVTLRHSELPAHPGRGSVALSEYHSRWWLHLVGTNGRRVTLVWSCARVWKNSKVIREVHSAVHREGDPLGYDDLDFMGAPGSWRSLKRQLLEG